MNARSSRTEKFVSAVHRRMVLLRTAEQLGIGMLTASALAVVLVLLAAWQALPTIPILIFCFVLAMLIGGGLAVYRRPSRASAAAETDRQLHFDDLLTTAFISRPIQTILSPGLFCRWPTRAANTTRPNEVFLAKLGLRSWGGIALAMVMAITLAAIPFGENKSMAVDPNTAVLSAEATNPLTAFGHEKSLDQPDAVFTVNDPVSQSNSVDSMSIQQKAARSLFADGAHSASSSADHAGSNGGRSASSAMPSVDARTHLSSSPWKSDDRGHIAGGGTESGRSGGNDSRSSGNVAAGVTPSSAAPSWRGGENASADSGGGSPVSDQISPEDRDLVRDYFNRP